MSALICALGCCTTTTILMRACASGQQHQRRWIACAAVLFGCSVWALHFVAMVAYTPGQEIAYDETLTALSIAVACGGAFGALLAWKAPIPRAASVGIGGALLGLSVSGMHYVGVAAMSFSGFLIFDRNYVAASVVTSIVFSVIALARASHLKTVSRRFEVGGWLALAVCGLHFTAMTAITIAPGRAESHDGFVLGTTTLAVSVGGISVAILIASLATVMVEQFISERALQDLARMRLMSNLAQEVLLIHRDGVVLEVNSAGERLFKTSAEDIIGRPVLTLFAEDSAPVLSRCERGPSEDWHPEDLQFQAADGTRVAVELSCQPIVYLGRPATVVAMRDLTDRKRNEARIRHLARHDALTDLPNRYNLLERIDIALEGAAQQKQVLAIVHVDLDRFKPVNDLHGHAAGDALLVQASKRILAEIHPTDTLARIGGDEFVLVLTSDPQPEKVSTVATRIIAALRRQYEIEEHRIEIGASVGIALFPEDGATADALMRAADTALHRVKEEGRGTLRFYEPSMNAQLQARLLVEQELAGAVQRGELVLHYQPIVDGVTGEVEACEALIRWVHPTRGMISPVEFIPLAEETGMIDQIGRWVIENACREAAGWTHRSRVAINVSPMQFGHSDICQTIGTALQTYGLNPARVVIEVTEGILIDDAARAVATLNRLREMGVRIALDDFGTGYSSLSYLQLFKFDDFKIDKSFVRKIGENDDALTLTRTIINLGHNLGLKVTAEGVETATQLAILQALGCDHIQGYLVARPAPISSFTDMDRLRIKAMFMQDRPRLSA